MHSQQYTGAGLLVKISFPQSAQRAGSGTSRQDIRRPYHDAAAHPDTTRSGPEGASPPARPGPLATILPPSLPASNPARQAANQAQPKPTQQKNLRASEDRPCIARPARGARPVAGCSVSDDGGWWTVRCPAVSASVRWSSTAAVAARHGGTIPPVGSLTVWCGRRVRYVPVGDGGWGSLLCPLRPAGC